MTIGIGGWGPRRKPMALVRAILRSDLQRPHGRVVRRRRRRPAVPGRQGPPARLRVRLPRHRPARAALPAGAAGRHDPRGRRARRGHVPDRAAGRGPAAAVPADAGRPRVRRARHTTRTSARSPARTTTARSWSPCRRSRSTWPWSTSTGRTRTATRRTSGPDPYFDDLFCLAAERAYVSCEQVVDTAGLTVDTPVQRLLLSRMMVSGVVEAPNGAALHDLHAGLRARRGVPAPLRRQRAGDPEAWAAFEERFLSGDEAAYQAAVADFHAASRRWRHDGRRRPAGRGLRRRDRRLLRGRRRDLRQPDGPAAHARRPPRQAHLEPRPAALRRRVAAPRRRARRSARRPTWSRAGSRSASSSTSSPTASVT